MAKRDYYEVLGVRDDADTEELRRAFRRQAKRWHPDRNLDQSEAATERFREIVEAWTTLGNPIRRRQYDRETGRPLRPAPEPPPPRPAPQPAAPAVPMTEGAPERVEEVEEVLRAIRRSRGRIPEDREALYGCLLLIAALTSPCWLPAMIGIAWHVYHVLADHFLR